MPAGMVGAAIPALVPVLRLPGFIIPACAGLDLDPDSSAFLGCGSASDLLLYA